MKLQKDVKISRRDVIEMIHMMATRGNLVRRGTVYASLGPQSSENDVRNFFSMCGFDFDKVVEECRNYEKNIPLVENIIGPTCKTMGDCKVFIQDPITGEEKVIEEGQACFSEYWQAFESSYKYFCDCINEMDYDHFKSALTFGVKSIDSYIKHRAEIYNYQKSSNILKDDKQSKVSFEDKIKIWIPIMTGGKKLKGNLNYYHFGILKGIRDNIAVHPKGTKSGIIYSDFCNDLNKFKTGIAGFLIDMHIIFEEQIPCKVIRAFHFPRIFLANEFK